jgi:arabinofuranosyltransferase
LGLLTVGDVVSPFRLEYTATLLSIGCTLAGAVAATVASAMLSRRDQASAMRLPLGLLVFVVLWPTWVWATGGMEVGLTFCWLGTCFLILARWATPRDGTEADPRSWAVALLGLGWLVRPELAAASLIFVGVVVVMSRSSRRQRARLLVAAALLPVLYQIFRMGYYGLLVATPAIAKEGSRLRPGYGWSYFTDFIGPYHLAIPLLTIILAIASPLLRRLWVSGERRVPVVIATVAGSGVLMATYVILVGGDYVHARLLMPALFAFLAPFFVVAASTRYVEGIAVTFAWAVLCGTALRSDAQSADFTIGYLGRNLTTEDRGFSNRGLDQSWIDGPGLYIGSTFTADGIATAVEVGDDDGVVVATRAIGALGYALGPEARILDLHGLADPLTAHQRLEFRSLPGHEKLASAPWTVAALASEPSDVRADDLPIGTEHWPEPAPLEFLVQVAWAQAALQCAPLERLDDASRRPLSLGGFISNMWSSADNTMLRISRDPRRAFADSCAGPLPAEVQELYAGTTAAAELAVADPGSDVVIVDDCAAVFARRQHRANEWQAVDGATFASTVRMDPADRNPRLAALWVLSPIGTSRAIVWAETDGRGNYRIRLDIDWFPPVLQAWTPIPTSRNVHVALRPDFATGSWSLVADWITLSGVSMLSVDGARVAATIPTLAGPSATAGTMAVDHAPVEPSQTCRELLGGLDERGGS